MMAVYTRQQGAQRDDKYSAEERAEVVKKSGWVAYGQDGAILEIELGEATLVAIRMYLLGIRDVTNNNQITFHPLRKRIVLWSC